MIKTLITAIATIALTGAAYAGGFGVGVSGSIAKVDASGSETTTAGTVGGGAANTTQSSVDDNSFIGSIFVDYEFDNGITVGFSSVPASADVSSKTHSRAETAQGIAGVDANGALTRTADAEVENFNTLYVEYPMGPYFAKLGWSQLDVNTLENAVTDSGTYGNATLDGYTIGFGANADFGGFFTKTSIEFTDFEDLSLTSTTSNTITADLDVVEFKVAVGKRF
jgi:hypothetical protein